MSKEFLLPCKVWELSSEVASIELNDGETNDFVSVQVGSLYIHHRDASRRKTPFNAYVLAKSCGGKDFVYLWNSTFIGAHLRVLESGQDNW